MVIETVSNEYVAPTGFHFMKVLVIVAVCDKL